MKLKFLGKFWRSTKWFRSILKVVVLLVVTWLTIASFNTGRFANFRFATKVATRGIEASAQRYEISAFILSITIHGGRIQFQYRPNYQYCPYGGVPKPSTFTVQTGQTKSGDPGLYFKRSGKDPGAIDWHYLGFQYTKGYDLITDFDRSRPKEMWHVVAFPIWVFVSIWWIFVIRSIVKAFKRAGRCPKCGYDMSGLYTPGCPECGYGKPRELEQTG